MRTYEEDPKKTEICYIFILLRSCIIRIGVLWNASYGLVKYINGDGDFITGDIAVRRVFSPIDSGIEDQISEITILNYYMYYIFR